MLRTIIAALLLFGSAHAFAQAPASQRPSPTTAPQGSAVQRPPQTGQQESKSDERGTEKSPLIVKMQNSPKNQAEAEQDADYQQARATDKHFLEIGIATIIVGLLQTCALIATFGVMAYVAVRQLRAYVYPEVRGLKKFSLTEPIEITVIWKNSGQTPAKQFECHGVVWIHPLPLPDKISFEDTPDDPKHSKPSLYPGTESGADYASMPSLQPLTKEVVAGIVAGQLAICVVAEAFYRDVFGCRRKSELCRYISIDDMTAIVKAERENLEVKDLEVKFVAAHTMNDFT